MNLATIDLSSEALIGSLLALCALFAFCRSLLAEDVIFVRSSRHCWKSAKILEKPCYCNACEILISPAVGVFCDCCGLVTHIAAACMNKVDRQHRCKSKWLRNENAVRHLWVKGNLPLEANCASCTEDIDYQSTPGLFGWRCAWCNRCYHNNCYKRLEDQNAECDLGEFRDMIFPPYCIVASRTRSAMRLHVTGINPPNIENWNPLIVIANTKSGDSTGSHVVSLLRGFLHPLQVMELGAHGPHDALQWAVNASPRPCRILIAGGDGTVGWVLNTMYALGIKPQPTIAVLPMGTGNDLARVMGWGAGPPSKLDPLLILRNIRRAQSINLDRFDLQIDRLHFRLPIQRHPTKTIHVYNYFSIGVDALVALQFHKTRESRFYVLSSRIFNKLIYFLFGTQQIVNNDCEGLEKKLDLYLDNELVALPKVQALIFLNIDSWGAGCKLCELYNKDSDEKIIHSMYDGVMEVFGIISSFHIAQLQCGMGKPVRIGQARQIKIHVNSTCPMQADGEPWQQPPANIYLQSRSQVRMLKLPTEDEYKKNTTR